MAILLTKKRGNYSILLLKKDVFLINFIIIRLLIPLINRSKYF